jgi:cysteine synthase A
VPWPVSLSALPFPAITFTAKKVKHCRTASKLLSLGHSFTLISVLIEIWREAVMAAADFVDLIGNTPLVRLNRLSDETGCEILGKCEFMNPGGSVKDRAAKAIIEAAEASGALRPGGMIVEGTAGNTGISLTMVANARGYRSVIVMPETQSQEKKDALRVCGADLRLVPALPYRDPGNYVRVSERLAGELAETHKDGVIWANQFDNIVNRQGHFETTGPEIWAQTDGAVDGFICAVGSGGTLAGTGLFLKQKNQDIKIGLADPGGSALYEYYAHGALKAEGNSVSEGIGQGRITANLDGAPVDMPLRVSDQEALPILFSLMCDEGLYLGGSSAINVAGAVQMAREMGRGHTIVTILCDSGARYQSKIWNPAFLRSKGLPTPDWLEEV